MYSFCIITSHRCLEWRPGKIICCHNILIFLLWETTHAIGLQSSWEKLTTSNTWHYSVDCITVSIAARAGATYLFIFSWVKRNPPPPWNPCKSYGAESSSCCIKQSSDDVHVQPSYSPTFTKDKLLTSSNFHTLLKFSFNTGGLKRKMKTLPFSMDNEFQCSYINHGKISC